MRNTIRRAAAGALLALAACSGASQDSADGGARTIGVVFDIGGRGDKGFNDAAARGADRAARESGARIQYLEPDSDADRTAALERLAREKVDLIIGVGFMSSGDLSRLAAAHPDVRFAGVDFSFQTDDQGRTVLPPPNLTGIRFREEEGAFVVGALAGGTTRTRRVGFVGGMTSPLIAKFQAGYEAGVRSVCPACQVDVAYAGATPAAFSNPALGHTLAARQYGAGADVIFHASGLTGRGVFRAARESGRLAIGVDTDQRGEAPGNVLTSMLKGIDVAVYDAITRLHAGTLSGGVVSLGLAEGGVSYVYDQHNRALIPPSAHARAETLKQAVIAGFVRVPRKP
jgi:basic membrane protein A